MVRDTDTSESVTNQLIGIGSRDAKASDKISSKASNHPTFHKHLVNGSMILVEIAVMVKTSMVFERSEILWISSNDVICVEAERGLRPTSSTQEFGQRLSQRQRGRWGIQRRRRRRRRRRRGVWEAVASPSLWGAAVDTEPTMIQCKDRSRISNQGCNCAVHIFAILQIFAVHIFA